MRKSFVTRSRIPPVGGADYLKHRTQHRVGPVTAPCKPTDATLNCLQSIGASKHERHLCVNWLTFTKDHLVSSKLLQTNYAAANHQPIKQKLVTLRHQTLSLCDALAATHNLYYQKQREVLKYLSQVSAIVLDAIVLHIRTALTRPHCRLCTTALTASPHPIRPTLQPQRPDESILQWREHGPATSNTRICQARQGESRGWWLQPTRLW